MKNRTSSRWAWIIFSVNSLLVLGALVSSSLNGSGKDSWSTSEILSNDLFALAMFSFPVVGVLIASRRPRNAIGWILLADGLAWALSAVMGNYVQYGLVTHPGSVTRPDLVLALSDWLWIPGVGLIGTFLLLLFPDGRLPSPRWRLLARLSAVALIVPSVFIVIGPGAYTDSGYPEVTNPLGIEALRGIISFVYPVVLLIPLCIIGCAAGLIQRFRRSRGLERLQLKWLAAGAGTSAAAYLVAMIVSVPYDWSLSTTPFWVTLIQNVALFSFLLIPLAAGIAMLKHQLYDIDLIINRALVYGAVSALLAVVYAGGVFGAGGVLRSVTGRQSSDLAVAGSTLAIAALFRPVRARMQAFIDRRFYRHKYDMGKTLQDFSVRMRDQLDLDTLNTELVAVVSQAVQPSHVTLWIRPSSEPH
ncbi:MAG: hypothetical protein H0U16_07210 [Actinobacteria bacterium]|nr:hypothetical protein [Actinomycetota bacterium]